MGAIVGSPHSAGKSSFENREKECAFCILERQIARSLSLDGPLDAPSKIHKCLADFAEHFRWRRQEDAHEFLRYVIGSCHTACLKTHKRSISGGNPKAEERSWSSTLMKEIFGGGLLSQVKCLTCKDALEQDRRDSSRMPSLDSFSLKCSNRKKLSVARKQMFIHEHPMCLSYSPRFEGTHGAKINRRIEFNGVPELSKFMCNMNKLVGRTSVHITQHVLEVSAYDWTKFWPVKSSIWGCVDQNMLCQKDSPVQHSDDRWPMKIQMTDGRVSQRCSLVFPFCDQFLPRRLSHGRHLLKLWVLDEAIVASKKLKFQRSV